MSGLTAKQRQLALREVDRLANELGMPEAVYVAEHGVTVLANAFAAARWATHRHLTVDGVQVPLLVTSVTPLEVSA